MRRIHMAVFHCLCQLQLVINMYSSILTSICRVSNGGFYSRSDFFSCASGLICLYPRQAVNNINGPAPQLCNSGRDKQMRTVQCGKEWRHSLS